MEILYLAIGLLLGALIGWLIAKSKFSHSSSLSPAEIQSLNAQIQGLREENTGLLTKSEMLDRNLSQIESHLSQEREKVLQLREDLTRSESEGGNLKEKLATQKQETDDLQKKFTEEFQRIADKIFLEGSSRIQQTHGQKLTDVLTPFKEVIENFERKVDATHKETIRENQSLKEQILNLQKLNVSIGEEAKNLTTALKGQSKTQGNWGEMILETILEKSGLVKGREYDVQTSITNAEGKRYQPDVILNLPEGKSLIIDSKVSLIAYERFCNAEEESERIAYLKEHIGSLRKHIKDLGGKNYQNLYGLTSLDFVLLFVPLEPAFSAAVIGDIELFNEAFDKNIMLVSPTTLLATLRTISSIWRQENQNRNALEIARQGGELYDKFVGFVDDLIDIGSKLSVAQEGYKSAMGKLHTGRGNLVKRAEDIRKLGAKASKSLPKALVERTEDDGDVD